MAWLLSLPFGKFFHIIEQPASIGVTLYQTINQDVGPSQAQTPSAHCRRCGASLPSRQFVADLTATLADLGQHYALHDEYGRLEDHCPTCKRVLRGQAYYQLLGRRFL